MSPRWSRTCTAVVGSLTAGDSALIAMSTITRIANAGSCSIVRSTPSTIIDRRRSAAAPSSGRRRRPRTAPRPPARSRRPPAGPRRGSLPRARTGRGRGRPWPGRHPRAGSGRRASAASSADVRVGQVHRRVGAARPPQRLLERAPAGLRDERRDRDGPQPVDRAVQEDEEEEDARGEEEPGERHAEARHRVLLHPPQERVREGERADQHREHGLEHPVAIEDPHVARRERAGRHLHDQDGDGDDEPRQPDARADHGGEHRLRRPGRVGPALGEVGAGRLGGRDAAERPGDAADDRDEPDASPHELPEAEAGAPAHAPHAFGRTRSRERCSAYEQSGPLSVDETDEARVCAADLMPSSASLTDASSGTACTSDSNVSQALESWLVVTSLRSDASLETVSQLLWMVSTADW